MKATAWEFRYRLWISCIILVLGFAAPWIDLLHWGSRDPHTWGWLSRELMTLGLSPVAGFDVVTGLAIAAAALAAVLRVWGTAYLGTGTVFHSEMQSGAEQKAGQVMADGPYRYVRNPLYLGSYLDIVALAILMPPSGALVCLVLLALFLVRLIRGEEAFLQPRLGEPYAAYRRAVPRVLPSLWPRVPASGQTPTWGRALLGETFPICALLSFAVLSWQYNAQLLTRAILISFGLSLVVRAIVLPRPERPPPAA